MSDFWQQVIVGAVVGGALFYLYRLSRKTGCQKGGGCGCSIKKPIVDLPETKQ